MLNYQKTITIDPNIRSGKPIIRSMWITVYDVLRCSPMAWLLKRC